MTERMKHRPEVCKTSDIFNFTPEEGVTEQEMREYVEPIDKYLSIFAKPIFGEGGNQFCPKCGKQVTGMVAMLLGGGFQWGLAHGEGFCGGCRWPARGHHFAKKEGGSDLFTLRNFFLFYMPSDEVVIGDEDDG